MKKAALEITKLSEILCTTTTDGTIQMQATFPINEFSSFYCNKKCRLIGRCNQNDLKLDMRRWESLDLPKDA